jgi:hypothetical protein
VSIGSDPPSDDFERAFVATNYLLGVRGEALTAALVDAKAATLTLARHLNHPDRTHRAHLLAPELARLVNALDARRAR